MALRQASGLAMAMSQGATLGPGLLVLHQCIATAVSGFRVMSQKKFVCDAHVIKFVAVLKRFCAALRSKCALEAGYPVAA